ncbi:hypothetical protein [Aerococcus urinaeequi]|uniref:hypothetical protein n=1 Tax=Aerococcus urinaeequi TaxID=51665 RepID=UPI003D6C6B7C
MEQVADLSIIKELLDTKTGYKIAKDTDIPQQTISRFQTGITPIENMKLGIAMKLTEYAKRKKLISVKFLGIINESKSSLANSNNR